MKDLFIIRITSEGKSLEISYGSVTEALKDRGLKGMFARELVTECHVFSGSRRITARPITSWKALTEQLVSNSATILGRMLDV